MAGYYIFNGELRHDGIKGMRWGHRRYQNKDGTLTEAGKKRYARDAREKNWTKGDDGLYRSGGKKNRKIEEPDVDRWGKEDVSRSKKVVDSGKDLTRSVNELNRATAPSKDKRQRMNLDNMTDREMRDQIQRELLERQYNDMFNPPKVKKGREYATRTLEVAGSVLGVTSSALAIALAIRELTDT